MEILESQDPEKKRLIEASDRHKKALEKQVSEVSDKTEKLLTNALVIGGALALSYLVVRQISSSKSKKKKRKKVKQVTVVQQPVSNAEEEDDEEEVAAATSTAGSRNASGTGALGLLSGIGQRLADQATYALIDLARQKLMEYLESRKKEDEAS